MKNVPIGGGTQLTTQKKKMKKKLFIFFTLFIALFAMSTSAFAQLANGTYYIKNVATGKYFAAGSSWGSHAIIDNHGIDVKLTAIQDGKYTIDTQISNGGSKNFLNGEYTDGASFTWTFITSTATDGTPAFYINNGEKNLSAQNNNINLILSTTTDDYAKWVFISEADRIADLANATTESGKDATWLIKGHNFGRNDTRNNAWQGGLKLDGDNTNKNTEKYNTNFDVNQTINVPNGKYVLEVQGYYRNGSIAKSSVAHLNGTENLLAKAYANSVEAPLLSIYADAGKVDVGTTTNGINGKFPNGQGDASAFFSAGAYNLTLDPVVVSDGTLKIGVKKTEKVDADWACFDNFRLTYYGPNVSDRATSTTSPAEVAADTWYAFDVPVAGDYTITPSAGTIYYTQNGELFPSEITTSTTEATQLALAQGKLYVKASEAATITFAAKTFTYEVGTASTDVDYVQKGQTITVSFANAGSNDPDVKFEQYKPITLNGEAVDVNLTDKAFTFVMPENTETSKTYTLDIPAEAFGYTGHTMNAAQNITLHTPAIFDGTYFVKTADNKYISRGADSNTEAALDEYGLSIKITTDNKNVSLLTLVDNQKPLVFNKEDIVYTNGKVENELHKRYWTIAKTEGGYSIKNIDKNLYLVSGERKGNIVATKSENEYAWTLETPSQHSAAMTALKNAQAKEAATAAGIDANSVEDLTTIVNDWTIKNTIEIGKLNGGEFYQAAGTRKNSTKIDVAGLYKLTIPAYKRVAGANEAYDMHVSEAEGLVTYIYFGNAKTQVRSLYSEEGKTEATPDYLKPSNSTQWFADRTGTGDAEFAAGKYANDIWVYISEPGTYEYGITNNSKGECADWTYFGTPKLTYYSDKNTEPGTDLTNSYLKNPGFETGDLTGWTTESSNDTGVKDANNDTYKTQGSEGNKLFNTWSDGKALTQNIGKLNAGVYELSAMLATGDNPDSKGTVYLTVNDTKSAGMVSRNGNKQVMHKETLTFVSDGKTEITIGAVGMEIGNGHWWYKADDFKLTFVDNTNNLFKVLTDVIANTKPWTTSGEYVNKYNEYKGLTETSAQADILSAINYLKTNYDNYAWENASVEHPYLMSNVIAKAELDDNTPWLGSGRLTKPNTDHWSGGKKTVFVQNSGEYARTQAITVPYSGKYLLKTAVRTFTDKAFANIKMGDVVSTTNTKTGNTGGNVNIDGTEGTNNRANGNAGYGWTFNNLNYWCDADNTNTNIAIQLSIVDNSYKGNEAQASGMFLYYVGQTYEQVKNGVHYYYGKWEANDVANELTNETPILDLTKATINGTVAIKATNKNGLVYTNSVNSLSGIDNNIVKDGTCENLVLTDGYPFTTSKNFEATKATYTMTAIADGKFGTLVLPFAAQLPTDGKAYALDGELNVIDGELVGSAVTSLAANKPVLVTKAGEYTASAVSVAETSASQINSNGNLTGVYQNTEAPVGSFVLQNHPATQGVAFYLVGEVKPTVKPFRAFIPAQDAKVKAIKVVFDGEATGIKEITSDNTKAEIFDLSGRRVAKAQKGVYIINGKKVIKK